MKANGSSAVHSAWIKLPTTPIISWRSDFNNNAATLTPNRPYSNMPLCFIIAFRLTKKSPNDAVVSNILPPSGRNIPTTSHNTEPKNFRVCHPISTTAKNPAKVL